MAPWEPHDLCECVGSLILGYSTAGLAAGMLFWYSVIAWKWWESSKLASRETANLWRWLVTIFVVCAIAGYMSWIIALWLPKVAVILRIMALAVQNVACPMFWYYAASRQFTAAGVNERIGAALASSDPDHLNDRELAELARKLVAKSLDRIIR